LRGRRAALAANTQQQLLEICRVCFCARQRYRTRARPMWERCSAYKQGVPCIHAQLSCVCAAVLLLVQPQEAVLHQQKVLMCLIGCRWAAQARAMPRPPSTHVQVTPPAIGQREHGRADCACSLWAGPCCCSLHSEALGAATPRARTSGPEATTAAPLPFGPKCPLFPI